LIVMLRPLPSKPLNEDVKPRGFRDPAFHRKWRGAN
jgi:hypothetical protein